MILKSYNKTHEHQNIINMCYHGNEVSTKTERTDEKQESAFTNKGKPTYAGFRSESRSGFSHRNPWVQG